MGWANIPHVRISVLNQVTFAIYVMDYALKVGGPPLYLAGDRRRSFLTYHLGETI